jgi:outer membrane lipoprotein-sorting protein
MRSGFGNKAAGHNAWCSATGIVWLALAILAVCTPVRAQASQPRPDAPPLEEILAGMDKSASGFTSMSASLEYTKVTVIVNDHSTQNGRINFEKTGGKTRVLISFTSPAEKHLLFAGGKVQFYQPKIAQVDEYQLSSRQDLVEQFLLLGFGTSGTELRNAYQITLRGSDSVAQQQCFLLDLVPKSPKVAAQLQRIQLWISPQGWEPIQQKFYEPGGDYVIARYSDMKRNAKLSDKDFRLPVKGNVRTVRPQGN